MLYNHLSRWFYFVCAISVLISSLIEGKGFGFGRGGGGFKGGSSRGSGIFSGSSNHHRGSPRGSGGIFGGSSGHHRGSAGYGGYMSKPHSRNGFKQNAMSFAAGAAGGVAAYSIMRSLTRSHHSRPGGYYGPGYGVGETCVNHEDMGGSVYGQFRCPLYGFPYEARYCCGEYGRQYCCTR